MTDYNIFNIIQNVDIIESRDIPPPTWLHSYGYAFTN